ncbi:MAG: hypothetical protein ACTHMC_05525 [Pseudobacter sp.]|uniref:hypothetical protein n=1 Tax=Pseudobacter sp. TaxID=2045420 RepID=UPI003F7E1D21
MINTKIRVLFMAIAILALVSCGKSEADRQSHNIPPPTGQDILNGNGARQSIGPAGVTIQSTEAHIIGG